MHIQSHETSIIGNWIFEDHKFQKDSACYRIEWLMQNHLQKLSVSPKWGDWEILFKDPFDGRYWELVYLQGDLHGGGPPSLICISEKTAREKYNLE
jgi:hypothetical protein